MLEEIREKWLQEIEEPGEEMILGCR